MKPYYEQDNIKIFHGDCRDILPTFPDKSFDLVLTDPPYGLGFEYLSFDDTPQNVESLLVQSLPEMQRVANRVGMAASISNLYHFPRPRWIIPAIWDTTGSYGYYGFSQWFPVLMYGEDVKEQNGKVNGILKSDVIRVSGGGGVGFMRDGIDIKHPCPKPLTLWNRLLLRLSVGDILDPFGGSGTTAVAAKQLGRKCTLIEIEEKYCEIAVKRLAQMEMKFV